MKKRASHPMMDEEEKERLFKDFVKGMAETSVREYRKLLDAYLRPLLMDEKEESNENTGGSGSGSGGVIHKAFVDFQEAEKMIIFDSRVKLPSLSSR